MPKDDLLTRSALSLRDALRWIATALSAAPLASLASCGDSGSDDDSDGGESDAESTTDNADGGVSNAVGGWATGGTAAMTALASYPDPFATAAQQGLGPRGGAASSTTKNTCRLPAKRYSRVSPTTRRARSSSFGRRSSSMGPRAQCLLGVLSQEARDTRRWRACAR